VTGGYWSTYWYQGRIYGTEIIRGVDVFALIPSEHLTANEIAAAEVANQGAAFNPQQQFPVTWPAVPAVSLAYLDQWARSHPQQRQMLTPLYETLHAADKTLLNHQQDRTLAASLTDWAGTADISFTAALRDSLRAISRRLSVAPPTRLTSQAAPQENK
jgi:hypothetical protein